MTMSADVRSSDGLRFRLIGICFDTFTKVRVNAVCFKSDPNAELIPRSCPLSTGLDE
jgi:hypothetical protein